MATPGAALMAAEHGSPSSHEEALAGPRKDAEQFESVIEHFWHLCIRGAIWCPEHDRQQPVTTAPRCRDQAAQGRLGPTGFQSVRARIGVPEVVDVDKRDGLVRRGGGVR